MSKALLTLLFLSACSNCAAPNRQHEALIMPPVAPAPSGVLVKPVNATPAEKPAPLKYYKPIDDKTPLIELRAFDENSVSAFLKKLGELDGKTKEIYIRIDSKGGSIFGGQEIITGLEAAKSNIVCVADWKAYSMGFMVLESAGCDWRLMTKRASLMAHEPSAETQGNAGSLRDAADYLDALNSGMVTVAAGRMKMSIADYQAKTTRRDWWMDYREAEKFHAIDGWIDASDMPPLTPFVVKRPALFDLLGL